MAEYHSNDTGETRKYKFRRIKTAKLKFRVKASHDAAICLSVGDDEEPNDIYEIFIGCWGGEESGIRRAKHDDVMKVDTPDILSEDEFRSFWITLKTGSIRVGKGGEIRPFMIYKDPETCLRVSHYGFSTGWGSDGDWIFEDGDDDDKSSSSSSDSDFSSSDSEAEDLRERDPKPISYKRPARWVPGHGGHLPRRAVCGGEGENGTVYVGLAEHEGLQVVGMVVPGKSACYIPYNGECIKCHEYYVLGNPGSVTLKWVPGSGGHIPSGALEGGKSSDRETLYIGRVMVDGIVSCGKVVPSRGVCLVPYHGAEHSHRDYEVLCAQNIPVTLL